MARSRRGSFGSQPRVAPNVTNQIVALAREYVAKRDSLIMDAWRNGGTFEGKPATDEMVLAYWQERGKDLDPSDPTYEQAKDQVMQLEYGIAQSKADVLHVQGKLSDTAYAQFFLRWATKVPHNSEFYRTLQKDAAQLIESAKAKGRAGSEAAKTKAFNTFVQSTTAHDIAIGDAMTAALNDLSKTTGLSITGNGDELLSLLTQNVRANPDQYKLLLGTIKTADPGFNGQLTEGYFSQHIKAATHGYELIADRAHSQGYVSAYVSATEGMAAMSKWGQNLQVWPVAESYSIAENAWRKIMDDPNASVMDKQAASGRFADALGHMASAPGIDAGSKTMIEADAQRLLGQDAGDNPSFGSAMLGRPGVSPEAATQLAAWAQVKLEMDANPLAWAYAPVDRNGQFDPTGRGPLGIVPAGAVQPGAQGVMIPGADGKAVLAMVMPHSVFVTDPSGNPKLAGYQLSYNVGGRSVQMWGYVDAQKQNHWSLVSPVAEGATTAIDNKGDVYVTPQAAVTPEGQLNSWSGAANLNDEQRKALLAGGTINAVDDTSAKGKAGVKTTTTLSWKDGQLVAVSKADQIDVTGHVTSSSTTPAALTQFSPQGAAFSQSRLAAGNVAGVTYDSPLQASVKAASYTQTQEQVNRYASDPAFQQAFLSQTMQTLGTDNPADPRIADAWKNVTTSSEEADARRTATAQRREDLSYPGSTTAAPSNDQLNIKFGHPELRLPGLPGSPVGADMRDTFDRGGFRGVQPQTLPGLGAPLPQTAAGSPAPSITATPGPMPSPSVVKTTPTAMPTTLAPSASGPRTTSAQSPYLGSGKAIPL